MLFYLATTIYECQYPLRWMVEIIKDAKSISLVLQKLTASRVNSVHTYYALISGFGSVKQMRVFGPPLEGKLINRRLAPSKHWYSFTNPRRMEKKVVQIFQSRQSRNRAGNLVARRQRSYQLRQPLPPTQVHKYLDKEKLPLSMSGSVLCPSLAKLASDQQSFLPYRQIKFINFMFLFHAVFLVSCNWRKCIHVYQRSRRFEWPMKERAKNN